MAAQRRCRRSRATRGAPRRCSASPQIGIGALISSGISLGESSSNLTVIGIFAITSVLAGIVLLIGARRARAAIAAREAEV